MKLQKFLEVCKKCRATCCKMGGPDFSEKEMKKVLKGKHADFFVRIDKNHYELKSKKGICPYLKKDNSCSLQNVKPLMCVCWPVCVGLVNNRKEFYLAECQLTKLLTEKDIQKYKKEASKIPNYVVRDSLKKSKLSKSDLRLIKKRLAKFKKRRLK